MNGHLPDSSRTGTHRYAFRIYYEDTDAGGVVYHANYLRYCERARTEALRDRGIPHAEMTSLHGLMFMVRRVNLDYLAPAFLDDSLLLLTRPLKVGAASVALRQVVHRAADARDLVRVEIELACVRMADQRAARMPPRWRNTLLGMMHGHEIAPNGAC
jgi:acyl-CoA thioester hydrolase